MNPSDISSSVSTITVKVPETPADSYLIRIATGFLDQIWEDLHTRFPDKTPYVITDKALVDAGQLNRLLQGNKPGVFVIDPPGEESKHITTVVSIIEDMEKASLGRDTIVVALGGGTVGDIAGFAAAVFKRGIPVAQIPTTTVSQADSSVGGKTGVDSSISKNAFGAFWQPAVVYIDTDTLNTLDDRQYRAGLAETVKHAAIADAGYFDYLEQHFDTLLARDARTLRYIAYENCRIKAGVVEEDPTEKNRRRILNYGHTIGHAVESASRFSLLHGEAVAIGMIAAGMIEQELDLVKDDRPERIKALLIKLNLPTNIPADQTAEQLVDLLRRDKKAVGKWPKFVLLDRLGAALCKNGQWAHDVPQELAVRVMQRMRKQD